MDDDPELADLTAALLEREDERLRVDTSYSAADGLDRLSEGAYDCIVSDYDMPEMDGLGFLTAVREEFSVLPFLLFTGKGSEEVASEAISAGVTDYLQKGGGTSQYAVLANRIRNVVERHRSKREAEASQKRLSLLFERSPLGIVEWNEDIEFERLNETGENILGYGKEELIGESWEKIVPEDEHGDFADVISEVLEGEGGNDAVLENVTADGERIVCEWHNRVIRDEGDVAAIFSEFQDVTEEHRRRERQRHQRETLLELAVDEAVADGDFETAVERITEAAAEVLDVPRVNIWMVTQEGSDDHLTCVDHYDRSRDTHERGMELATDRYREYFEALKSHWAIDAADARTDPRTAELTDDYLDPNDVGALLDGTLRSGGDVIGVICHEHVGGTRTWFDDEVEFAGDVADVVHRAFRNREQIERREELERYESIVENSEDGIYVFDESGRFEFVNRRVVDATGIPRDEWEGEHVSLLADLGVLNKTEIVTVEESIEAIVRGETDEISIDLAPEVTEDLSVLELRLTPLTTTGSRDVIGFSRDVSERIRDQERLERKNERLEEFASVVSHDLRNPLNLAKGRLGLVRDDVDHDGLDSIANALERMERIVDDVLWLAREGRDIGSTEPVDLRSAMEATWTMVVEDADNCELDLAGLEGSRPVEADYDRFRQLLENLLGNATEHGGDGATVTVGQLDGGFFIEDDGPGIPEAERGAVFDPGYSTTASGTGFGLAIVDRVAEAHGWDVSVTDGADGGARFEVTGVTYLDE